MDDNDGQPIKGELVGPEGDGQWLSVPAASALTNTPQKTLYRRVERHQIPSRKNADGRIEVWIADAQPLSVRQSSAVAINVVEARELMAPLVEALTVSHRQSQENLARALAAEAEIERLQSRLSEIRTVRLNGLRGWIRRWLLLERDDSQ